MNSESIVKLIEEMMDIKVQAQAEAHLRTKPELAHFLEEKRQADRRRLELVKLELSRQIGEGMAKN